MKQILICFTLFLTPALFCQTFQISDIYSDQFSIDKIAQQVYFKDLFTDTVRIVDLKDGSVKKTKYTISQPIFSNQYHLMVYRDSLYDLDKMLSYKFNDTGLDSFAHQFSGWPGSFSLNDSYFIYGNTKYYVPLSDSTLTPIETDLSVYEFADVMDAWPEWSSDTSFVYVTGHRNNIAEYFLKSGRTDTLVSLEEGIVITGFAYNKNEGILAYSLPYHPRIYFHYVNNNTPDSLFFDTERDEPDNPLFWEPIIFTSLTWSPDERRLAFICEGIVNSFSVIRIYDMNKNTTYQSEYFGLTNNLTWANNDTIILSDATRQLLYGLDVDALYTSINTTQNDPLPVGFSISNYPNPFNLSTSFRISFPEKKAFEIKIYDSLGRLIKTINVNPHNSDTNNIRWNGTNNFGKVVSTGVYYATAIVDNEIRSNTIKLLLIK